MCNESNQRFRQFLFDFGSDVEKPRAAFAELAAAYKHVPLVEHNILEGFTNNIIGTKNTIDLSIKYKVEKFVLISTEKALLKISAKIFVYYTKTRQ